MEEEFLRRKTLEEKEELTSLKKAIFWFIALEKREVPRYYSKIVQCVLLLSFADTITFAPSRFSTLSEVGE